MNIARNENYYVGGTRYLNHTKLRQNVDSHPDSVIYDPYPKYNSWEWRKVWKGKYQACMGPRGKYLDNSPEDMMAAYIGTPRGVTWLFKSFPSREG
jgi:hypothetical protein